MIYFVSTLIAVILGAVETSFLPHFKILGAVPFLLLAFILALSLKNKGYFHLVIAFFAGLYLDHISGGFPYTFLIVFLSTALISRIFLFRDSSYNIMPLFLGALSVSTAAIYFFQINVLFASGFHGWQSFLITSTTGIILTLFAGFVLFSLLGRYFDWLQKVSEEKFRG